MVGRLNRICQVCGSVGFTISDDGFYYCDFCSSQADDIIDTGVDEEHVFNHYTPSCNRTRAANAVAAEPMSPVKLTTSQYLDHPNISTDDIKDTVGDAFGPTGPSDFGSSRKKISYEEYYSEIRSRYLTGMQVMIQLQCQALVEKFNASPLIIGLAGPLWLRFVASTRITSDEWADRAVHDSEAQTQGDEEEFKPTANYRAEPVNIHGKSVVYVWHSSLRTTIPLSCSLAISFLVCHVAREAITPSDMLMWTLEGKLPYFNAFGEIEKQIGSHSEACPISVSRMFRPIQAISSQKLESLAAAIAQRVCLELPPVNFNAIASRYLRQLALPSNEILPMASLICEWSTPAELYLSANEFRIPTRVCVMSILIVTIRILFDIKGCGMWESSLSNPSSSARVKNDDSGSLSCLKNTENADEDFSSNEFEPSGSKSHVMDSKLDVIELLRILEAKYCELNDMHAYSGDLSSYLQYCKDVVFSGLWPSYEDLEEEKLIEEFWGFYQKNKGAETPDNHKKSRYVGKSKHEEVNKTRSDQSSCSTSQKSDTCHNGNHSSDCGIDEDNCSHHDEDLACDGRPSGESPKDKAIRQLKLDMQDNKFCYIPPRTQVKSKDYLHYARTRKGVYIYTVHADYYILLRSCAKVAQVEPRIMHIAVLTLERRLRWLEKRVDQSLHFKLNLNDVRNFCSKDSVQNAGDDATDLNI